jgi:serine/threonine-protein kinase
VALWSLLVGLLVTACVAGGWYLLAGRYTTAPDVLGQTRAEALATLTEDDFAVSFAEQPEFSADVPEGSVLEQSPGPAGRVVEGGRLTLVLSAGPEFRPVPAVAGMSREQALSEIERAGLTAEVTEGFDPAAKGAVARTDPPAGEQVRKGEPVQVLVSKGPEMLPVPDVRGQSLEQARAALEEAGFTSAPTEAFSEDVEKGAVAGQTPAEGAAARGSAVQLTVSKGPERITVPDVNGRQKADAEAALKALGLKVDVQAIPGPGKVRSTSPGAGKAVRKGSTVTLFVF